MDRLGKGAEILFCYRPTERLTVRWRETVHQPLRSRTLCEVPAVLVNYFLNSYWTFRDSAADSRPCRQQTPYGAASTAAPVPTWLSNREVRSASDRWRMMSADPAGVGAEQPSGACAIRRTSAA